ncbi:MAG: hypothetical protein LBU03_00005, partial [Tannerellaceae bacterium]|nr:hypothetical protein [Tannerellaceae bacterium]
MLPKQFNVAGPCKPSLHYMIDPARRLAQAETSIRRGDYFVIHAARQSGKTTYLQDIVRRLNAQGDFYALYCSLEAAQNVADPEKGIPAILSSLTQSLLMSDIPFADLFGSEIAHVDYTSALMVALRRFSGKLDKPFVLLFDEADCLSDNTLISFLRQLRLGYIEREQEGNAFTFPYSLALVGMRNIRDYKAQIRPDGQTLGSASPFNIAAKSLTLA